MNDNDLLFSCGGIPLLAKGANLTNYSESDIIGWDFGWIPPENRTQQQEIIHSEIVNQDMVPFSIQGRSRINDLYPGDDGPKALLWKCWSDPRVMSATDNKLYSGNHQFTGSCVGAGGGNAIFSLSAVEVARLNDPEQALIPFWLIPYGRSRFYAGMRGPGEGSLGSTFAKAVKVDGVIPANTPGLPPYKWGAGLEWGASVEREWSAGERISESYLEQSRKHLIQSVAPIKSAADAREALVNGYAVTWCGSWGGMMKCEVREGVLMNRRQGTWNHQQSCHGWWDHPKLGNIFYILNQWTPDAHGRCPCPYQCPPGGYWISEADFEWQARNGECYAFSQFNGFPAPDWDIIW